MMPVSFNTIPKPKTLKAIKKEFEEYPLKIKFTGARPSTAIVRIKNNEGINIGTKLNPHIEKATAITGRL